MSNFTALENLLCELCVEWGFCNRLDAGEMLDRDSGLTADAFATAVLSAEGYSDPTSEIDWHEKLKRAFVDRFGADQISN